MINILSGINATSSALEAERARMEVITQNIANANQTHESRDANGKAIPYQRRQIVFEKILGQQLGGQNEVTGVQVARIIKDQRAPQMVYEPGNPDADSRGMVAMPNVNIHEEMADLIAASRAFEANLAVVRNARTMALQTLAIGKH